MDSKLRDARDEFLVRYGGDRLDGLFVKAEGSWVTDDQGRKVLDFTSGQMCATLGHNHPDIVSAVEEAGRTAYHLFSGMIPDVVADLARTLANWMPAPLKRSLFVNTGSESGLPWIKWSRLSGRIRLIQTLIEGGKNEPQTQTRTDHQFAA